MSREIKSSFVLEKRVIAKTNRQRNRYKAIIFLIVTFLFILFSILFYLFSANSRLYKVNYSGLVNLNDRYLNKLGYLKPGDILIFKNENQIRKQLLKNPLIKDVKVKFKDDNCIDIDILENKIVGYSYDSKPLIHTSDNRDLEMDEQLHFMISKVPYIHGFKSEELKEILPFFESVDQVVMDNISEIRKYEMSYDPLNILIVFKDGNYFFVSRYALTLLNNAFGIISNLKNKPACIFLDEVTKSGHASSCPWQKTIIIPKEDQVKSREAEN